MTDSGWEVVMVLALLFLVVRINRANFALKLTILGALFGMPMFAYLLLRSKRAHAKGSVAWKGRTYSDKPDPQKIDSDKPAVLATGH